MINIGTESKKLLVRVVLIPLLLVAIYLYGFMPDRYESSALVLVKDSGAQQIQTGLLAQIGVQAGGVSDDLQLLHAHITSKSLALELDEILGLREHYAQSWDFLFGISESASTESYYKFYRKHIRVNKDVDTGLLAINVQAYTPEFTAQLADEILKRSEAFINNAGRNIAKAEMAFALSEIELSQEKLKAAKVGLLGFQNQHNLVSPDSEGESLLSIIFELEGELAKSDAELGQASSYLSADAPKIKALKTKANALRKEIEAQKRRVTGEQQAEGVLNELGLRYQSLLLDVELATTLYTSALSAYELARVQAGKQLKYLVVAAEPEVADEAEYPRRGYWLLTWLILFFVSWLVSRMIIATATEHKD